MKRHLFSLLALGLILSCQNNSSIDKSMVIDVEQQLDQAYLNMDSTALKALLDKNYAMRTPGQTVVTKRRQMRAMGFDILDFSKLKTEVDSVELKDSLAFVYGTVQVNAEIIDTVITGKYQFKRTWVNRNGRLVALNTVMER